MSTESQAFQYVSVVSSIGILPIGRLAKAIQLSNVGRRQIPPRSARTHKVSGGFFSRIDDDSRLQRPFGWNLRGIFSHRMQEAAGEGSVFKSCLAQECDCPDGDWGPKNPTVRGEKKSES